MTAEQALLFKPRQSWKATHYRQWPASNLNGVFRVMDGRVVSKFYMRGPRLFFGFEFELGDPGRGCYLWSRAVNPERKSIQVRLPPPLIELVEAIADEQVVGRNVIIRLAIEHYIEHVEAEGGLL